MSAFAYFLPGIPFNEATDEKVESVGLRPRLADCFGKLSRERMVRQQIHANGPDGKPGTLIVPQKVGDDAPVALWSAAKWDSELSDNGKFWITWLKDDKPGPAGLRRRTIVAGVSVEMLDGNNWTCPTIRKALCFPNLPCSFARKNGDIARSVVPEYRELWDLSAKWAAACFSGSMPDADLFDVAARCLAVNYRVGDEEIRILNLFDAHSMSDALDAAIDAQFFIDAQTDQKKMEWLNALLASARSTPGDEDSIRSTPSAAAS